MQGELTLRLSSSWMYIAYTSFLFDLTKSEKFFWVYLCPFVDDWQKGGEKFESFRYACFMSFICNVYFFFQLISEHICFVFNWYQSIYVNMCYLFYAYIEYLYCLLLCRIKEELLWSLTLIHAYITPWVLSLSKRGRLLAQRPITLTFDDD